MSVVRLTGVSFTLIFSCTHCGGINFILSLFLYLDLYLLGDDTSFMQTKNLFVLIHIRNKSEVGTIKLVLALQDSFLLTVERRLFCGSFLLFIFRVCHAILSVHCSLVVTC